MDGRDGIGHSPDPAYDALSFGRYLKAIRLQRGIALEAVASETRIPCSVLRLLEAEDHATLPDEVFVKGFLRSYAETLTVDPENIVRRYQADSHLYRRAARYRTDLTQSHRQFWFRIMMALAALTCLILVSAALMMAPSRLKEPPSGDRPPLAPQAQQQARQRMPLAPLSPSHSLVITAMAETWIKVIIDGQMPRKYALKPGERIELTATREFNLLIGNAGGIALIFDHNPLPIPGKTGQTVTLRLPRHRGR
jgi:transcriptional regulator with XRE-family HTH domain